MTTDGFLDGLERLLKAGLDPLASILLLFVLALGVALVSLAGFFWRTFNRDRKTRDQDRDAWRQAITADLALSKEMHRECTEDRGRLDRRLARLEGEARRVQNCQKHDCPLRLPS